MMKRSTIFFMCLFLAIVFISCERGGANSTGCDRKDPVVTDQTGTLPVPDSLETRGMFEVSDQRKTGPNNQYRLFFPKNLGQNGIKHPLVVFPSSSIMIESFKELLHNVASHGFVVIAFMPTLVPDLTTGLDWLIAENKREGSMFFEKLDTGKIAAMGQSFGGLKAFELAADPRMTTTIHLSGGTLEPHAEVKNLHAPALFLCGEDPEKSSGGGVAVGDMAYANCAADFEAAVTPVFFGMVEGGSHVSVVDDTLGNGMGTAPDNPQRKLFNKAIIGWLRWQLAEDRSLKAMFVGEECGLCSPGSGIIVKQKNLN